MLPSTSRRYASLGLGDAPLQVFCARQTIGARKFSTFNFQLQALAKSHHGPPRIKRVTSEPKRGTRKDRNVPRPGGNVSQAYVDDLLGFQTCLSRDDLHNALVYYPNLVAGGLIYASDAVNLARLFHEYIRQEAVNSHASAGQLDEKFERFVKDYKNGKIPPHRIITTRILACYKDSGEIEAGLDFWKWAASQEDHYCNLTTYGTAIELLAISGQSLEMCEEVYDQGLKRFHSGLNAYHLSAGAVLTEPHLPTRIAGTSTSLLQGIAFARLYHGNWRRAYLALDRALQLHPQQVPRNLFTSFLDHRPVFELVHIFRLFCQGGSFVLPSNFTTILSRLGALQRPGRAGTLDQQVAMTMLSCIRYAVGSGQKLDIAHMTELLRGALCLLPKPTSEADSGNYVLVRESAILIKAQICSLFARLGIMPEKGVYSVFLTHAARLEDVHLIRHVIKEFLASESATMRDERTKRLLLQMLQHVVGMKDVELSRSIRMLLGPKDQVPLSRARRSDTTKCEAVNWREGVLEFLDAAKEVEQLLASDQALDLKVHSPEHLMLHLPVPGESAWQKRLYTDMHIDPLIPSLTSEEQSRNISESANSSVSLSRTLWEALVARDPPSPGSVPALPPGAFLSTCLSLAEVRFSNWRGINDILLLADEFEKRGYKSSTTIGETARLYQDITHSQDSAAMTEEDWRARILELRSDTFAGDAAAY